MHLLNNNSLHLEFCIRVTSGSNKSPCNNGQWRGGDIILNKNYEKIATFQHGFTDETFCLSMGLGDVAKDVFQLKSTNTDGVSISCRMEQLGMNNFLILKLDISISMFYFKISLS